MLGPLLALVTIAAAASPPNVVLIVADDLGWGDLGSYGQKEILTPRLDRMAAEGTRFLAFYAGSTVCAPSRSVLMTGQHTGHTRIRGNARVPLAANDVTMAEVLKSRGYATGLFGKWGLGEAGTSGAPERQGFDEHFGYLNQTHAHNYYPSFLWRNGQRVQLKNVVPGESAEGAGVASQKVQYSHDLIADEALGFVRRQAGGKVPFFLYAAFTLPHANNEAKADGMEVPELGGYVARDWPAARKRHAAMVTRLDRDVGRILDLLSELKIDDRTLVLFTSDNGPHSEGGHDPEVADSNGPWRGQKRDLTDGGIRVPMIARWPGRVPAGKVEGTVWWAPDLVPTLARLAGARAPTGVDGVDAAAMLLGRGKLLPRLLYWEFHEKGFHQAARLGRWKAIRAAGNPLALYDLEGDPGETVDVAAKQPRLVRRLQGMLAGARTESPRWPVPAR